MPAQLPSSNRSTDTGDSWADLNGRWFFAWRMAAACEEALREVHQAMDRHPDSKRLDALEHAGNLLRLELVRWMRRGEALDMIVKRIPAPSE